MGSQQVLTAAVLQEIFSHAETHYPGECCGLVFADATVHRASNIQDALHRQQPEVFRRTAGNGYTFAIADSLLLQQSLRGGNPARIIYHSHPDVGAYFSREDQDKALFMGEPIFPVAYLVVDVRAARAWGARLFEWNGSEFSCSGEFANRPSHG
ncbi:adenylyltransferase/sulfurtransferase [Pseudomonas nitritireducens]|uniref:Adenylyltransferase/sulfurtransferase n=1 Tax=Pseudomonas nitroreducens TaxID=46680 RepID=A0A7W7P0S0_PSENT|nr:adenylyltransferase/sulfurtransferase [Pseudomonas nitritireducens]